MSIHQELEEFLMTELEGIAEFVEEEPKRALAAAETIAAVGKEIPEYLLQLYIIKVPAARHYIEGALAFVCGLDLLEIQCTCSNDEEKLHCFIKSLFENEEFTNAQINENLGNHVRQSVSDLRGLLYEDLV